MGFRIGMILLVLTSLAALGEASPLPHNSVSLGAVSSCKTVGECLGADDEMAMDSDIGRRLLLAGGNTRHISYDALKKDEVPCNRKGQSYYNCTKMKKANPYKRGCSAITHCKRYTG